MTKRILLHVGWPKTGSTSLQIFFAQNIEKLRDHGIAYPEVFDLSSARAGRYGQGNAYSLAYGLLRDQSKTICNFPKYGLDDFDRTLSLIDSELDVLLSTEWFTELDEESLAAIRDVGLKRDFRFVILGYLRPLVSFLNSEYGQGVKIGSIRVMADEWDFSHSVLETADRFKRVFGQGAMVLRPFRRPFPGGSIQRDFLASVGVDQEFWEDFKIAEEKNLALRPEIINIQLEMNRLNTGFDQQELAILDDTVSLQRPKILDRHEAQMWFSRSRLAAIKEALRSEGEALTNAYFFKDDFLLRELEADFHGEYSGSLHDICLSTTEQRELFEAAHLRMLGRRSDMEMERAHKFARKANSRLVALAKIARH